MSGFRSAVVSVSYLDENGDRVMLGSLGTFMDAVTAVSDHTSILALQHGPAQLVGAIEPIITEFEDGTVLRYRLEAVDEGPKATR